jgi:hypothetical protein
MVIQGFLKFLFITMILRRLLLHVLLVLLLLEECLLVYVIRLLLFKDAWMLYLLIILKRLWKYSWMIFLCMTSLLITICTTLTKFCSDVRIFSIEPGEVSLHGLWRYCLRTSRFWMRDWSRPSKDWSNWKATISQRYKRYTKLSWSCWFL